MSSSRGRLFLGALYPFRSLVLGVSDTLIGEMLDIIPFGRLPFLQTPIARHALFVIHPSMEENMEKRTVKTAESSTTVLARRGLQEGNERRFIGGKPECSGN